MQHHVAVSDLALDIVFVFGGEREGNGGSIEVDEFEGPVRLTGSVKRPVDVHKLDGYEIVFQVFINR